MTKHFSLCCSLRFRLHQTGKPTLTRPHKWNQKQNPDPIPIPIPIPSAIQNCTLADGTWQSCWPFFEIDRFEQRMLAIHPKILFDLRSRGRLMWVKRGLSLFWLWGGGQWAVRGQRFTAVTVIKTFRAPSRPEKFTVAPAECAFPTAIQMRTHFKNVDTQHRAIKFIFHSFVTSVCVLDTVGSLVESNWHIALQNLKGFPLLGVQTYTAHTQTNNSPGGGRFQGTGPGKGIFPSGLVDEICILVNGFVFFYYGGIEPVKFVNCFWYRPSVLRSHKHYLFTNQLTNYV